MAAPSHPGVQVIDRDSKTSFDYQIDETSRSDAKAEIAGRVTDYVESKGALCLCLHGWRAQLGAIGTIIPGGLISIPIPLETEHLPARV